MTATPTPDVLYAELFEYVQSHHVFPDSKTFVDAQPKIDPAEVLQAFRAGRDDPGFDIADFVDTHFELPGSVEPADPADPNMPVEDRIEQLWDVLTRAADEKIAHSSLIPLPNPYVVPGGRFREVYYWDSYFTMLGLADSGRIGLIADMVENFAYLIDTIGFVPNGNRTYYCTRSQPPYFALMVELLADAGEGEQVWNRYLPQLVREYEFWMDGADRLKAGGEPFRRVVAAPGGLLNRYWDDAATPRQESYAEDVARASRSTRNAAELYRDIRAACESGWDFSSRWFENGQSIDTVCTTRIVPVDLNALLYKLEQTLAQRLATQSVAGQFADRALRRKQLIQGLFFDETSGTFVDLVLPDLEPSPHTSLAAAYPLFFGIATPEQAARVAERIDAELLSAGGWLTTARESGQQWDSPNGWAPMQWISYRGLRRYGFDEQARRGAERWVDNVLTVYRESGRLLEKYNVVEPGTAGSGGEYEVQDGFGWSNAVLLHFMRELGMLS